MRATRPRGAVVEGMDKRARAHVQVQTGCDHRCTFCIIPFGRGNSRSVPADEVVTRVRRLVETGHQEIVLTGVDITSWGEDLDGKPELGVLAGAILREIPELPRLRLSSIDAEAGQSSDASRLISEPLMVRVTSWVKISETIPVASP